MPHNVFKNKIRLRVNGILKNDQSILLVQINSPVSKECVWMPPGGGVKFGESMRESLKREFQEETGLKINVGGLSFINELVQPPFHAVECYFEVQAAGGTLGLGKDPELADDEQLLTDLQWVAIDDLHEMNVAPDQLQSWLNDPLSKRNSKLF